VTDEKAIEEESFKSIGIQGKSPRQKMKEGLEQVEVNIKQEISTEGHEEKQKNKIIDEHLLDIRDEVQGVFEKSNDSKNGIDNWLENNEEIGEKEAVTLKQF
jgi:hypothetical protein